jgi:hypothetical protein
MFARSVSTIRASVTLCLQHDRSTWQGSPVGIEGKGVGFVVAADQQRWSDNGSRGACPVIAGRENWEAGADLEKLRVQFRRCPRNGGGVLNAIDEPPGFPGR